MGCRLEVWRRAAGQSGGGQGSWFPHTLQVSCIAEFPAAPAVLRRMRLLLRAYLINSGARGDFHGLSCSVCSGAFRFPLFLFLGHCRQPQLCTPRASARHARVAPSQQQAGWLPSLPDLPMASLAKAHATRHRCTICLLSTPLSFSCLLFLFFFLTFFRPSFLPCPVLLRLGRLALCPWLDVPN